MSEKEKSEIKKQIPGVYASSTTSSLKSIANKPIEAYNMNMLQSSAADQKRKKAEAEMATSPFRVQPFVSPISGRKKQNPVEVVIAHGRYNPETGKLNEVKEPVVLTEEALAGATFTLTSDISKILATQADESVDQIPIQGRLLFSTLEGEFEIDANLVRIKLENGDVYAQYDRKLDDVLKEQFGKFKGPKPFKRIIRAKTVKAPAIDLENEPIGLTTDITEPATPKMVTPEVIKPVATTNIAKPVEKTFEESTVFQEETVLTDEKSFAFYYEVPTLDLLEAPEAKNNDDEEWALEKMTLLERTFQNFGVGVSITGDYTQGATVTQFEIAPDPGTKMSRIKGLSDDLKLSLSVDDLRIEPIPGKSTVGIEIANDERRLVRLKEILSSPEFILHESPLFVGLGEDISGAAVYTDILTMPHGLVAGQTGSGKSVCINTILVSILYKSTPDTVRLMLIDPKRVEMAPYNDIPHLVTPVITDEKKAATALSWAVEEMERRYDLFARNGVRDIKTFNKKRHDFVAAYENMPYIVIIIDELADLMMVAAGDVEDAIMRLTQKARAAGIHLIVATQRPTVNVITGTIKSNIPTRIAFAVAQANDSRVILDTGGAEDLLGRGDLLIAESGNKIQRVQGAFVSDDEVARVVEAVKAQGAPKYLIAEDVLDKRMDAQGSTSVDPLEKEAMQIFIDEQKASVSLLQRKLNMGYNRAARLVDQLELKGWITAANGATSKRDVLLSADELRDMYEHI